MRCLKQAWQLWSNILTFAWLTRLWYERPRLATAIAGFLVSLSIGLYAWYYLDPRFRLYEKNSFTEMSWAFRIFMGVSLGMVSVGIAALTIASVKDMASDFL